MFHTLDRSFGLLHICSLAQNVWTKFKNDLLFQDFRLICHVYAINCNEGKRLVCKKENN